MFYDEGLGLVRMAWTPDPLLPRLGAALLLALTIVSARKPGEGKLSLSESAGSSDFHWSWRVMSLQCLRVSDSRSQ